MMMRASTFLLCLAALPLAACNEQAKSVRISAEKTTPAPVAARSEPVFFNGKTYQFELAPKGSGSYDLAVAGMSSKQEKDAVQLATSSMRYFACPDGKTARLENKPAYAAGKWKMAASCA